MEYAEEDYEISNKVVSDYLHRLGYDDDYNELKKFDKKNEKNENLTYRPVPNLNFSKFHPVAYLFNSEFLIELVKNNREIFNESISNLDNQTIIKENLKFIQCLEDFSFIRKLIDQEEETSKIVRVDPLKYDDNLILYLRSCLLNSFDLKNQRDNQAKAEKTKLIRMGLECCSLYLDQIETSLGLEVPQVKVSQASPDKPESENFVTLQETIPENQELIFEDEIFEAENDPNSMVKEKLKNFEPEELSPKEKQELLNTKNLFYELKYALKWKTNEWKEREKRAKHVNDRKPGKISEFGMKDENHLLDNDILIYKSGLRKRTDLKSELKQFNEKKSKYSNHENWENYRSESHSSILSDIMAKRNKLMCQSDESEEIFGD
ncbi:hypothetical protein BpHYR1_003543 [Brachionus plicatilis]|uniref:Uncharacterized protein n=1 Tax=Brachionus plicatilis TaxID=10195 RepID=A0A3M7QDK6_BRAPC|nr:hypothetical protein BpHYR1_003543 [Brachionus plicatilis]